MYLEQPQEIIANRFQLAAEIKKHAMLSFNQGTFGEAVQLFKKGFEYMKKVSQKYVEKNFTLEQQKEFTGIKLSFLLNVSLCYMKEEKWKDVQKPCEQILKELDPNNVKALY